MQYCVSTREPGTTKLIAGRLRPIRAELPCRVGASPREIHEALALVGDCRDAAEQTIDSVVERLLTELTW